MKDLWKRRPTRFVAVVAVTALIVAGAAVAATLASNVFVDGSGAYHGCVNGGSGTLRVVIPGESCRGNETAIDWNQAGQVGPKGDKGEPGPKGDPGADITPVIVGEVNEDGTIARGTGFDVTKTTAFGYDLYFLKFPGGSCGGTPFPVVTVIPEPLFVNAPALTWRIAGVSTNCGTGVQTVSVGFVNPDGTTATTRFGFHAVR